MAVVGLLIAPAPVTAAFAAVPPRQRRLTAPRIWVSQCARAARSNSVRRTLQPCAASLFVLGRQRPLLRFPRRSCDSHCSTLKAIVAPKASSLPGTGEPSGARASAAMRRTYLQTVRTSTSSRLAIALLARPSACMLLGTGRWDEWDKALQQLVALHQDVRRSVPRAGLESQGEASVGPHFEAIVCEGRPGDVAAEPLEAAPVAGRDGDVGMEAHPAVLRNVREYIGVVLAGGLDAVAQPSPSFADVSWRAARGEEARVRGGPSCDLGIHTR